MLTPLSTEEIYRFIQKLNLPKPDSRKGDNGKLLIIGGSELFHAASRWSLDVASKLVDMVFYSSVPTNNKLITEAKQNFWNGIVIPRSELEHYAAEAGCILIGPGMERHDVSKNNLEHVECFQSSSQFPEPSQEEWHTNTQKIVNYLLSKFSQKKWVVDAGALQMVNPNLLNEKCVITPHHKEMGMLKERSPKYQNNSFQTTALLKGPVDQIIHQHRHQRKQYYIKGGNAGLTKGGTGDVLAGLLAGLYTNNDALPSTVAASFINKKTGEKLYEKVGPFYNATDLVNHISETLWETVKKAKKI